MRERGVCPNFPESNTASEEHYLISIHNSAIGDVVITIGQNRQFAMQNVERKFYG